MLFEEYLHLYADGALNDAGQTELFHIIAVSPEKRAQFNDFQTMRSVFVKDRSATVVPEILEKSILSAASSAVPMSIAAATKATLITSGAWKVAMPYLTAASIAVSGAVGFVAGKMSANNNSQPTSTPAIVSQQHEVDTTATQNIAAVADVKSDAAQPTAPPVTAKEDIDEKLLTITSTLPPARWAPQGLAKGNVNFTLEKESLDSTTLTLTNNTAKPVTIKGLALSSAKWSHDGNFFLHDIMQGVTIPAGSSHVIATVGFTTQTRNHELHDTLAVVFSHHTKPTMMIPIGGQRKE